VAGASPFPVFLQELVEASALDVNETGERLDVVADSILFFFTVVVST